jgi:N-acetylmuramoyl-L-alanine amidase
VKRKNIIFGIVLLLCFGFSHSVLADRYGFVRKVVIDPGHGGKDPGAVGSQSMEKDIVLSIGLQLGAYIEENFDDVEVIYTRTRDEFVELSRRAQIANENKADLFISIHCNASPSSRAYGSETFVMGLHKSEENLKVAKLENASILYEEDYLETYGGYNPNSPESNIIFSLFQNTHLNQSLKMASLVQDQFRERARRVDRGVKQAGFIVLWKVTMPGVLVEAGFLSNAREEKYLMSEMGQAHIASAIFRAFRDYKIQQDAMAKRILVHANGNGNDNESANIHPENNAKSSESVVLKDNPSADQEKQSEFNNTTDDAVGQKNNQPNENEIAGVVIQSDDNDSDKPGGEIPEIIFRVQFATTSTEKPLDDPFFQGLEGVNFYIHQGLYKYTLGNEPTLEGAAVIQKKLHEKGFNDAFVVAFKDEERIPASEALRLLKNQSDLK